MLQTTANMWAHESLDNTIFGSHGGEDFDDGLLSRDDGIEGDTLLQDSRFL
jgi:hypothetical protein